LRQRFISIRRIHQSSKHQRVGIPPFPAKLYGLCGNGKLVIPACFLYSVPQREITVTLVNLSPSAF
jgi:hypothetical protein